MSSPWSERGFELEKQPLYSIVRRSAAEVDDMSAAEIRTSAYAARDTGLGECVDGMSESSVGLTQGVKS